MNIEELRDYGLSLPHVTERCPFGPDTLSLEIGGKMFCLIDLSGEWPFYNLKVAPEVSVELQDRYATVRPGYHMNKKHWVSIDYCSGINPDEERAIIRHAYRQTAKGLTKKHRCELGLE